MLTHYRAVKEVSIRIDAAIGGSLESLSDGRVEQEPAFTDRMLGRIEQTMDEYRSRGIHWKAKTLTDRGPNSQESINGADFLVVVDFDLVDYRVSKGFLAQAKLLKHGRVIDLEGLRRQCQQMLALSPVSYVFLYTPSEVRVVSANSTMASTFDPTNCYSWSAKHFFEEHLKCMVGDQRLNAANAEKLSELRREFETGAALLLHAEPDASLENFVISLQVARTRPLQESGRMLKAESKIEGPKERRMLKGASDS